MGREYEIKMMCVCGGEEEISIAKRASLKIHPREESGCVSTKRKICVTHTAINSQRRAITEIYTYGRVATCGTHCLSCNKRALQLSHLWYNIIRS